MDAGVAGAIEAIIVAACSGIGSGIYIVTLAVAMVILLLLFL